METTLQFSFNVKNKNDFSPDLLALIDALVTISCQKAKEYHIQIKPDEFFAEIESEKDGHFKIWIAFLKLLFDNFEFAHLEFKNLFQFKIRPILRDYCRHHDLYQTKYDKEYLKMFRGIRIALEKTLSEYEYSAMLQRVKEAYAPALSKKRAQAASKPKKVFRYTKLNRLVFKSKKDVVGAKEVVPQKPISYIPAMTIKRWGELNRSGKLEEPELLQNKIRDTYGVTKEGQKIITLVFDKTKELTGFTREELQSSDGTLACRCARRFVIQFFVEIFCMNHTASLRLTWEQLGRILNRNKPVVYSYFSSFGPVPEELLKAIHLWRHKNKRFILDIKHDAKQLPVLSQQ